MSDKPSEKTKTELMAELDAMVARIATMQSERSLSDAKLLNDYPDIGSAKTWKDRLLARKFNELNLERWHRKLLRVCTILDGGSPEEDFFPDLPFAEEMRARLLKLERQTNDRRILPCLAPNGTGKSAVARWAVNQSRSTRAMVRLRPSWRNKIVHITRGIVRALGEEPTSSNPAECEEAAIRLLRSSPRTLFLDQAHEGGVAVMHLLRAFVDETPSRFVYLAYNTAYRNVLTASTDALIEAQAFLGRCLKPAFDLYKEGTRQKDVAFYLRRVAALTEASAGSLAAEILPALNRHTNLRLLDDAIAAARADDGSDDPKAETIKRKIFELSGLDPKAIKLEEP
jgi:hypothetical protein